MEYSSRPRGTSVEAGASKKDEFPPQSLEVLLGSAGLEKPPADTGHGIRQHRSDQLGVFRERLRGGRQHSRNCPVRSYRHLSGHLCPIDIRADGVKRDTRLCISHFGGKKRADESRRHPRKSTALLLPADSFDRLRNFIKVAFQCRLEERTLIGKVLIQSPDGHSGPQRDSGGGQPFFSNAEQNLNSRFENRVHARSRTCLDRRFTGLQQRL